MNCHLDEIIEEAAVNRKFKAFDCAYFPITNIITNLNNIANQNTYQNNRFPVNIKGG